MGNIRKCVKSGKKLQMQAIFLLQRKISFMQKISIAIRSLVAEAKLFDNLFYIKESVQYFFSPFSLSIKHERN